MIYPQKLNSKKSDKLIYILLGCSLIIAFILTIINRLTSRTIPWAALANTGIIYLWITVIYSIKRGTNIAGHVLLQTIVISVVTLYIDERLGFKGWSIHIAIPIILIVANITMLVLTIISYKRYIKYALYQLMIVLISIIPIIFIIEKMLEPQLLYKISIAISILNFVITLILCYKELKEAIVRKFHM